MTRSLRPFRRLASLPWLVPVLLLCACPLSPRTVDLRPDSGDPVLPGDTQSGPALRVSTDSLDFGSVGVGTQHEKTLTVDNVGDGTLEILDLEIELGDAPFAEAGITAVEVEPGEQSRITLIFEPVADGPSNTALLIHSNDTDQPTYAVDLNGQGVAPVLEVDPAELALGPLWIGCEASERLWLYNAGGEGMLINAADLESDSDELLFTLAESSNGPLPWSLGAEGTLELGTVAYTPVDARSDVAYLTVGSSDERVEEVRVDIAAQAEAWEQVQESFVVPTGEVDVVVALDRSTSMDVYMAGVIEAVPLLVEALAEQGLDFQLAIGVDEDGCVNGAAGWIDASFDSDDVEDAVEAMIAAGGGAGSLHERAFTLLQRVLSVTNLGAGGCNEGLHRDGSALHLLGISDEPEQSAGNWEDHVSTLEGLASDPSSVVFHAIAGDDHGCGEGAFDPFDDAVAASGGALVSLCTDDWSGAMSDVAAVVGDVDTQGPWILAQQPVVASISVSVDEVEQLSGWSFDDKSNGVTFDPDHAPSPGALIAVDYALQPKDCGQ